MSTEKLSIAYDGPALAEHEINTRVIAPALLALSDLFDEANKVLNGKRAKIHVNIRGSFTSGRFGFDISVRQTIVQAITNLASLATVHSAANLVTFLGLGSVQDGFFGVIQLLKLLRGRTPRQIEVKEESSTISVEEESFIVDSNVVQLYKSKKIRQALNDGITEPLSHDEVDLFTVRAATQTDTCTVTKGESAYLSFAKEPPQEIQTSEVDTTLQILGLSFQDEKWHFSDEAASLQQKSPTKHS